MVTANPIMDGLRRRRLSSWTYAVAPMGLCVFPGCSWSPGHGILAQFAVARRRCSYVHRDPAAAIELLGDGHYPFRPSGRQKG
jgi:hypothetical protein